MSHDTLTLLFFQVVVLGLVLFIAKRLLSNNAQIYNKPVPLDYFEQEKKEVYEQINELKKEIKELHAFLVDIKVKLEKLEQKVDLLNEYRNN